MTNFVYHFVANYQSITTENKWLLGHFVAAHRSQYEPLHVKQEQNKDAWLTNST